jgi:hypothetical protein
MDGERYKKLLLAGDEDTAEARREPWKGMGKVVLER